MRKTKSTILEAVHDTAKGLHKAGVLDQVTLRSQRFNRRQAQSIEFTQRNLIQHAGFV